MAEGYTLPVWVAAAARAALLALQGEPFAADQPLELIEPPERRPIPVVAAAPLGRARPWRWPAVSPVPCLTSREV
jgi:hypothetical protein